MPSFERLNDSLLAHLARSEYEKGYAEGYIRGKNIARGDRSLGYVHLLLSLKC